jgi:sugar (pentulose or hexulose) kinase
MKRCLKCGDVLRDFNKSGYCSNCIEFSPGIKAYQKEYQIKRRKTKKYKEYQKEYQRKYRQLKNSNKDLNSSKTLIN